MIVADRKLDVNIHFSICKSLKCSCYGGTAQGQATIRLGINTYMPLLCCILLTVGLSVLRKPAERDVWHQ